MDENRNAPAHHEVEAETARGLYEAVKPGGTIARGVNALERIADGIERGGRELARGVEALEMIVREVAAVGIVSNMLGTRRAGSDDFARAVEDARRVDAPPADATREAPTAVERKTNPPPR